MDSQMTNEYIRQVLHHTEPPPSIECRFYYASPVPIDDPLSPLPPTGTHSTARQAPKPFSEYDNTALDNAWHALRSKILKYQEERGEKEGNWARDDKAKRRDRATSVPKSGTPKARALRPRGSTLSQVDSPSDDSQSIDNEFPPMASELPETSGHPFIRAPSRGKTPTLSKKENRSRPKVRAYDTYLWEDPSHLAEHSPAPEQRAPEVGPTDAVAVGISRLHQVEMPELKMTPIYWTPVNDAASVVRGTWFYQDTWLPVETHVAIMLEAGYIELQVWTQTWKDELESAVEVGAAGEMKIVHKLWPEKAAQHSGTSRRDSGSRPTTASAREDLLRTAVTNMTDYAEDSPETRQTIALETASDLIDIANGAGGADTKAAGTNPWGRNGSIRTYQQCGVIYANEREARILKPNLLPSAYYGRRPLANYIRKGRNIGVAVTRGFNQAAWDKLHPPKTSAKAKKAEEGIATSASGASPEARHKNDPDLARAERPRVTDLVLVIHGIGQKLSQRMEAWHFTHAINAFRREVNVEVGTKECKARFRRDMGSIMVLPVNWRHTLSFEEGGYRSDDPAANDFNLADITPDTLPSIRNIVSDVMLDVPYYMSHHQSKMIAAVVKEANRVYHLWCTNNSGFAEHGRVHIIGHSLGSVMSVEILSHQPTRLPPHLADPINLSQESIEDLDHFLFNTHNLFLAGSPAGFFLLLKKARLLPRIDSSNAAAIDDPSSLTLDICGKQGQYGCIAVENVYNLINGYDPVAYRMNATVDAAYASYLKKAWVPVATTGWFSWGATQSDIAIGGNAKHEPRLPRLPSTVELETHNFTREEIGEKRMRLLNDNAQIDFYIRYGGGPLDIQYLTMLSAHASYWLLKDFTRMIVLEVGRPAGPTGTLLSMRATKGKG